MLVLLMNVDVCVCVCVCVQCFKINTRNKVDERHNHHTRVAFLMSRGFMKALQQSVYTRVGSHAHTRLRAVTSTAQTKADQSTNMNRLVYLAIFVSLSECSLSACFRILATVRPRFRHHTHPSQYDIYVDPMLPSFRSIPPNQ